MQGLPRGQSVNDKSEYTHSAVGVGGEPTKRTTQLSAVPNGFLYSTRATKQHNLKHLSHALLSLQTLAPPQSPVTGLHCDPHWFPHPHPTGSTEHEAAQFAVFTSLTWHLFVVGPAFFLVKKHFLLSSPHSLTSTGTRAGGIDSTLTR